MDPIENLAHKAIILAFVAVICAVCIAGACS